MTADAQKAGWAAVFMAREWWTYPEALFWIALRNPERIAAFLAGGDDWNCGQASTIRAMVVVSIQGEDNTDGHLQSSLLASLALGSVSAVGRQNGSGALDQIPPVEWPTLMLDDGPGLPDTVNAFQRTARGNPRLGSIWWGGLMFNGAQLRQQFPPQGTVSNPAASAQPLWHPRAGEFQSAWVFRNDVVAEAEERIKNGRTAKRSVNGALAEMAVEAGTTWTQAAIGTARNRGKV